MLMDSVALLYMRVDPMIIKVLADMVANTQQTAHCCYSYQHTAVSTLLLTLAAAAAAMCLQLPATRGSGLHEGCAVAVPRIPQ